MNGKPRHPGPRPALSTAHMHSSTLPEYVEQAVSTAKDLGEFFAKLRARGWTHDPDTGYWTHPDHPHKVIMEG